MPDYNPIRPRLEGIFGPETPVFQPSKNLFGEPRAESDIGMEGRMHDQFLPTTDFSMPVTNRMESAFSPETRYQDMYANILGEMPQRTEPNIWRRLGAIFAGTPEEQEAFKYAGYNRRMNDWNARREAIEPGLTAERYANTNERAIKSSEMQNEAANRRIDVQEGNLERQRIRDENTARQKDEQLKIQKHRAETYRYRTEHPNNKMFEDENGNVLAFNPQTKETEYLLDDDGQPIKSNALSPFDKQKLQLELIRARAQESRNLEGLRTANNIKLENQRQSNRIAVVKERGDQTRETKTTSPDQGNVQTTTQTTQVKDAKGNVVGTRTNTTQRSTQKGNNIGVKMQAPNGKIVLVPKDKVEEAKKKGGKVVP